MSITVKNNTVFNTICRICLKSHSFLTDLFQTDASDMLKFCGFLEVNKHDEFPKKICVSCKDILTQSYELKKLCITSKIYLESLLECQNSLEVDVNSVTECNTKVENNVGKIEKEQDFEYECPACGEKNVFNGHCCNDKHCEEQDIKILKNNCDTSYDYNDINQQFSDQNEESELVNNIKHLCPLCKITFEHEQDLFVHQSIHGDDYTCSVCKKMFKSIKNLKRHLKTHMTVKSHTCKICNKSFTESSDVARHAKRLHLGIPREKNYECRECGQRFTDQYYLTVHHRKHTGEKPLECDLCDKSFYDPRSLRVHLDAHKGIKPYLCNYCGKSFLQNAHLRQHIVVHSNEKPYLCSICDRTFTQSQSLQRHQKVHLTRHRCNICSELFSKRQQLRQHKDDEHNLKRNQGKKTADNKSKSIER